MFLTKRHLDRRTVLKGMGVTLALPLLEAMVPAARAWAQGRRGPRAVRLHRGAARLGGQHRLRARRTCGRRRPSAATSISRPPSWRRSSAFKNDITIVSNTDCQERRGVRPAGDRRRPFPLGRGVPDAGASEADPGLRSLRAGTSIDQLYAQRFGQEMAIPSMQLCIENVDQAGGCEYGYSCAYTDSISWAVAVGAAADDSRPARGVRSAVRRRRDACRSGRRGGSEDRSIIDAVTAVGAAPEGRARPGRSGAPHRLPRRRPRDRAADPAGGGARTRAASRASCRARRRACPTRSKSTSS